MFNPEPIDGDTADTLPEPPLRLGSGCIKYGPVHLVWGRLRGQVVIPLPGGAQVAPDELMRMARREGYQIVWPREIDWQ